MKRRYTLKDETEELWSRERAGSDAKQLPGSPLHRWFVGQEQAYREMKQATVSKRAHIILPYLRKNKSSYLQQQQQQSPPPSGEAKLPPLCLCLPYVSTCWDLGWETKKRLARAGLRVCACGSPWQSKQIFERQTKSFRKGPLRKKKGSYNAKQHRVAVRLTTHTHKSAYQDYLAIVFC